jgi:protein-tyrosine phosphatase
MLSHMNMKERDERVVRLHRIPNFRDFGGYPCADGRRVKRGILFRSSELHRATREDWAAIANLGIRLIIDLREPDEVAKRPDRPPPEFTGRTVHLPMPPADSAKRLLWTLLKAGADEAEIVTVFRETYESFVDLHQAALSGALSLLTKAANLPVLIHCQGGKDRTGYMAAIILSALGVPQETILADYLLTNELLKPVVNHYLHWIWLYSFFRVPSRSARPVLEARPEYLRVAIDAIDKKHGSMHEYLESELGMSPARTKRLVQRLTEGTAGEVQ